MSQVAALTPRERIARLFQRQPVDRMPFFSGQGMVTQPAIQSLGLRFPQIHLSAEAMAAAATATVERYGFDAAVVPYDMCTVPEAMGLRANFYEDASDVLYPTIPAKWGSPEEVTVPPDIMERGRLPVVSQAIGRLRQGLGEGHAIGTWLLGPFTLAGQLVELDVLLKLTMKDRPRVERLLDRLTELIIHIGRAYQGMGVDYISLREMGTGADILSPRVFREVVQPRLRRILDSWQPPRVLHICGATDPIVDYMKECGAEALSVDHKNDLAETRRKVGDGVLLLGNLDVYRLLGQATVAEVRSKVLESAAAGADAVWPGCDVWPELKEENLFALAEAVKGLPLVAERGAH
jgi:[methyl-Co(III) methanol-specific corrinoid protein]:coenzyme M methyltransferase